MPFEAPLKPMVRPMERDLFILAVLAVILATALWIAPTTPVPCGTGPVQTLFVCPEGGETR